MPDSNKIREKRQAAGLTLKDVAEKIGTTAVTVSRWEREPQRVTLPVLENLARAIGCSEAELIGSKVPKVSVSNFHSAAEFFGIEPAHFAVVVVPADTMEPTLRKGDLCYLDTRFNEIDEPGMYCVRAVKHARIVRCHVLPDSKIRLMSDNPLYKADYVFGMGEVDVIGKVIGYTRKV